jgi:N-methylhydantoinase B
MAHGDTRLIPIELQETILPFRIEEFCLRQDSAGPGKFRGGLGFVKRYRILEPSLLQTNLDRTKFPPWGVQGGGEAKAGNVTVTRAKDGKSEAMRKAKGFPIDSGDLVTLETGGGGGYGKPSERAPELIRRDIRRGYVSREAAKRDYGIDVE